MPIINAPVLVSKNDDPSLVEVELLNDVSDDNDVDD